MTEETGRAGDEAPAPQDASPDRAAPQNKATPDVIDIVKALTQLRLSQPTLSMKKAHEQLKQDNQWSLSLERLKKIAHEHALTPVTDLPFKIETISTEKGRGGVACRDICAGEIVLAEHPMLICMRDSADQAFDMLDDDAKAAYSSLKPAGPTSYGPSSSSIRLTQNQRIFQANAYRWSEIGSAIFKTIPLLNHSCLPNCHYTPDLISTKGIVVALRDIRKGEELTSTYVERVQARFSRKQSLREMYSFGCHCEVCNLPLKQQQKSDLKRLMARNLDTYLAREGFFLNQIMAVHLRIRLLLDENLDGPDVARSLNDAVQFCAMAGETILLSCYARLAVEKYRSIGNFAASNELTKYIKKPEDHPRIMLRRELSRLLEMPPAFKAGSALKTQAGLEVLLELMPIEKEEASKFEADVKEEAQAGLKALENVPLSVRQRMMRR